jgi:hypothetical protein
MISVRIEYEHVNDYGGFSQYAMTVRGESLKTIELEFNNRIPLAFNASFSEVTA